MREIKFRMYRDGRMQTSWSMTTDEAYNYDFQKCEIEAGEGGILMQFTGLKDKNGKEIYESDIVLILEDEMYSPIPNNFKGEVKMMEGCWYIDNERCAFLVWQEIADWEVIGNIYENHELLKEGKPC